MWSIIIRAAIEGVLNWFKNWFREKKAEEDKTYGAALAGRSQSIEEANALEKEMKARQDKIKKDRDSKSVTEMITDLKGK